jgi:hypothetical protein
MTTRASAAVAVRFVEYLHRIEPAPGTLDVALQRTRRISAALRRTVNVVRALAVGSFYKRTAIRDVSDLDFFVVLRRDDVRWGGSYMSSTTVLDNVRDAIVDRFPSSDIGRDGSAVTVMFTSGVPIDVVPAVFQRPLANGYPLYVIPDGDGGWLETSPDAQRNHFAVRSARSGGKLRRSVQLVKAWAQYRDVPLALSSFYVESVLANAKLAEGIRSYSQIFADSFALLASRGGSAMRDPLGISGLLAPTRTDRQRQQLERSLDFAASVSQIASAAEEEGFGGEAAQQWRRLLHGFRS